ncbi:hypothetical protein [Paludisphaera soli]|uniref:hypothetical protein n=1 Tax=Paludisphaera soli TaxID=2712865 RepID=UPI0013EAABF4|nr:hypothetical protein [Paludisphaera soli]
MGVAVGTYAVGGTSHGFIRLADGSISAFDVAGALSTYGKGINDGGTVVGYFDTGLGFGGYERGVDGTITPFVVPGAVATYAGAVNNLGQIAGTYSLSGAFDFHGFIRAADGTFSTFDVPGASWTYAQGINDQGEVSGFYFDGLTFYGYLRASDGGITTYAVEQSMATFGTGLNDVGTAVGYSVVSFFTSSGFVTIATGLIRDVDGAITSVVVPGGSSTYVSGINDRGQLVGSYVVNGVTHGFITPVPEPGGCLLLATGALGALAVGRARRRG